MNKNELSFTSNSVEKGKEYIDGKRHLSPLNNKCDIKKMKVELNDLVTEKRYGFNGNLFGEFCGNKENIINIRNSSPINKSDGKTINLNDMVMKISDQNLDDSFEFDDDLFDECSIDNGNIFPDEMEVKDFYRFKVVKVETTYDSKVVFLTSESNEKTLINLELEELWEDTFLKVGDICNIINPIKTSKNWKINNTQGLLVVNPDLLVSSTTITSSMFCQRKTVLQHYFSDLAEKSKKSMVIGSFIHSVFQECTKVENLTIQSIKEIAKECLKKKNQLLAFYECHLTDAEIWIELEIYFPQIVQWITRNITRNVKDTSKKIIVDIEESIYSAKYGMKGKIDLTMQSNDREKSILPLELKTGKSSFAREHTSQVLLYTLMMSERREQSVDEGVLLYIKDGKQKSVLNNFSPNVLSITKVRNELTYFLIKVITSDPANHEFLPPPLENDRFCHNCEYLTLCSTFSRLSNNGNEALKNIVQKNTEHLCEKDFSFLIYWIKLIIVEYFSERLDEKTIQNVALQKSNNSLRNVTFESFKHNGKNFINKLNFSPSEVCTFSEGDPVMVSTEDGKKIALLTGFISDPIVDNKLTISSEKPLICAHSTKLRIDPNNFIKIAVSNLSVLANLMNTSDISTKLRQLIVHGRPPSFKSPISKDMVGKIRHILKKCNHDQKQAIKWALLSEDYSLIKGYPGSGKTACIISLIRIFLLLGKRVLVSSYTHSAVRNILQKLDGDEINFMYLNGNNEVCEGLRHRTLESMLDNNKVETVSQMQKLLMGINVIGVTCLSTHSPVLSQINFDIIIIDEAGQITLPISLMPLLKLKSDTGKFILVGDLHQLPPLVKNSTARVDGLDRSLFAHLCEFEHEKSISELTMQYRMNKEILKLCNEMFYENKITCATNSVSMATLSLQLHQSEIDSKNKNSTWKSRCFSDKLSDSVLFLSHQNQSCEREEIYCNKFEASLVMEIVQEFIKLGIRESDIGIISPYNMQKELLINVCCPLGVEINTVDQYQGKDKSIIIISFVRQCSRRFDSSPSDGGLVSDKKDLIDILKDQRRLNVALTRPKHKLIMLGNFQYLRETYEPFRHLFDLLNPKEILYI